MAFELGKVKLANGDTALIVHVTSLGNLVVRDSKGNESFYHSSGKHPTDNNLNIVSQAGDITVYLYRDAAVMFATSADPSRVKDGKDIVVGYLDIPISSFLPL